MTLLMRVYDGGGQLLGFMAPDQAGPSQHGYTLVGAVEFVVRTVRIYVYPDRHERCLWSLVLYEPFDGLWDWPGFVRFTGWDR